jgi:hypothetical protein
MFSSVMPKTKSEHWYRTTYLEQQRTNIISTQIKGDLKGNMFSFDTMKHNSQIRLLQGYKYEYLIIYKYQGRDYS